MEEMDLKTVKEVNGWKVNHPRSGANIVYALFSLLYVAFPLLFLFIDLIANDPMLTGLDIFKFLLNFLDGAFKGNVAPQENNHFISLITILIKAHFGEQFMLSVYYIFVGMGVLILLFSFFSIFKFVLSITHLAKGYLDRPKAILNFAITEFIFTLLFSIAMTYIFLIVRAAIKVNMFIWYSYTPLGVSLFFLIFFSSMYNRHFKDSILEKDLELHQDEEVDEDPSNNENVVPEETKNVTYEQMGSSLPSNLTSIGGHAFSENQNLINANIPPEVTKLGPGAFANCLNLQTVYIPNTIKEIGFNCFFNCVELDHISYGGTKAEWKKVKRGSNWLAKAKTTEVNCLDGVIVVNPFH